MSLSSLLQIFKEKIEDAAALVQEMGNEERDKAVEFWNVISEQLQIIVNNSTKEIPDYIDATQLAELGLAPPYTSAFISVTGTTAVQYGRVNWISFGRSIGLMQLMKTSMSGLPLMITLKWLMSSLEEEENIVDEDTQEDLSLAAGVKTEEIQTVVVSHTEEDKMQLATGLVEMVQQTPFTSKNGNTEHEPVESVDQRADHLTLGESTTAQQPLKILVKPIGNKTEEDSSCLDCQIEDVNGSEVSNGLDEGNTVHLMISAESSPIMVPDSAGQKKPETFENKTDAGQIPGAECDGEYECEYCKKRFSAPSQLSAHIWTHTKPYVCLTCGSRFSSKGNLVVHSRRHTGEKPFPCSMCGARFSTHGNLARHRKSHSGEKPWKCQECDSCFVEHKSLKVHMRRHTGERPYICHICQKSFTQAGILQTHLAMHSDERAYKCTQCARRFRQKSQLRLHEQRHAGIRKYQCSVCGYRFLTKGDMERHQRTHTGERPFTCKLCNKSFTRQQSLNEHLNRHYGLKPYQCKYCNKGYVEMSACYKHIKTHERGKDTPESQPKPKSQPKLKNSDEVLSPTGIPPTVVAATAPDSDKIVFLVQNNAPDKRSATTHPVDLTTVIIQRVPDSVDEGSQGKEGMI
ncbi:uncharacterized protein [Anabrus simplex]|uniref:uncharacterized protein n=1 Tax=Anabrus simplex TaxID=316456 RepID=UPI0035A2F5A1